MKTATQIIEEVREDMCNNYCKHIEQMKDKPTMELDEFCAKYCEKCPLNRL